MVDQCMNLNISLHGKEYKLTPQRQAVLDVLVTNKEQLLSYEEIYEMVRERHPEMGMAAVYRALPLLEKMGLLSMVHIDDGYEHYRHN